MFNELAKAVHENAKAHGWWDTPRSFDEICALMISELSEALEEARAGRPMEWHNCIETRMHCLKEKCNAWKDEKCEWSYIDPKPEGIAVEMADCAIRILDYLGGAGFDIDGVPAIYKYDAPVETLAEAYMAITEEIVGAWNTQNTWERSLFLNNALQIIGKWFKGNELDFMDIATRKHEYNKTRPYMHGKKF